MIHVTRHAKERYQERVAHVSLEEAEQAILRHETVLDIANRFGARCVRNGDGVGFLVKGGAVVSVLAPNMPLGPLGLAVQ